jgi:Fe-S-cluster containining protein
MSVLDNDAGPLVMFKRMHGAFAELIGPATSRATMVERLLDYAFESFEECVATKPAHLAGLACHGGCASCCTIRVAVTAPEVLLVLRYIRALQRSSHDLAEKLVGRIEAANEATEGLDEWGRMTSAEPCPFLEDGLCVIYPIRPLACRSHVSFSDKACVEALSGELAEVPVSALHMTARSLVQNALQSSLRDAGFGWATYELNLALLIALKNEHCEADWMAGIDVFAPALVGDVSAEEMAQTFDAIKTLAA